MQKLSSDKKQLGCTAAVWKRAWPSPSKGDEVSGSEGKEEGTEAATAPWNRFVGSAFLNEPGSSYAPDPPAVKTWRAEILKQVFLH